MVSVSFGSGHVLVLTDSGEIYGWGKNDSKQVCEVDELMIQVPIRIELSSGQRAVGLCCGPAQTVVWSECGSWVPRARVPFVIDLNEITFRYESNSFQ